MWIKYLAYWHNRTIKKLTLNETILTSNLEIKHAKTKPKDITNKITELQTLINRLGFQKEQKVTLIKNILSLTSPFLINLAKDQNPKSLNLIRAQKSIAKTIRNQFNETKIKFIEIRTIKIWTTYTVRNS